MWKWKLCAWYLEMKCELNRIYEKISLFVIVREGLEI